MSDTITVAVAGKGGVGKTTFSALLTRVLVARAAGPVLAVDADPNSNLGELLGLEAEVTVGSVRERTFSGPQAERERPAGWDARSWIEYRMQQAVAEGSGFDLLVMGRPEGPGCYCYANSLLREYLQSLSSSYRWVVVDNEAGLEHLSRRLCRKADVLFVVDDGTPRSRQAAQRIGALAEDVELDPGEIVWITNQVRPSEARATRAEGDGGGDPDAPEPTERDKLHPSAPRRRRIPFDPILSSLDAAGLPLFSLPEGSLALQAVTAIVEDHLLGRESR